MAVDVGGTIGNAGSLSGIPLGTSGSELVLEEIDVGTDVDMYEIFLNAGDILFANVDAYNSSAGSPTSLQDSYLRVFDGSGTELNDAVFDDDRLAPGESDGGVPIRDSYTRLEASSSGFYYIGVSGFSNTTYDAVTGSGATAGATGIYDLVVTVVRNGEAPDYGNAIPTAEPTTIVSGPISQLQSLNGVIGNDPSAAPANDIDMFSLDVTAGDLVRIDTDAQVLSPASPLNSFLRLFDVTGAQLAENDDEFPGGLFDSRLSFSATTNNTYYVGVSSSGNGTYDPVTGSGATTGSTFGEYALNIAVVRGAEPVDFGDTRLAAELTGLTPFVSGVFDTTGALGNNLNVGVLEDVDMFIVDLNAGDSMIIDIDAQSLPTGSNLDSIVRVFDASGSEVGLNDDEDLTAGLLDSKLTFTAATTGPYYVGVSGFNNSVYDPDTEGSYSGSGDPFGFGQYALNITTDVTQTGDGLANTLLGGDGIDRLFGLGDTDLLDGGPGNDVLVGGEGDDLLLGGPGSDTADYSGDPAGFLAALVAGNAVIDGFGSVDTLVDIETIIGSAFSDTLFAGPSAIEFLGGDGGDILFGGAGSDVLRGEDGDDFIFGGGGSDIIEGGNGVEFLSGNDNFGLPADGVTDTFVYSQLPLAPPDVDIIDFDPTDPIAGGDVLDFSSLWSQLVAPTILATPDGAGNSIIGVQDGGVIQALAIIVGVANPTDITDFNILT